MTLSAHRKHKIYIAATMGYGLGSEDPEETSYLPTGQGRNEERQRKRESRSFEIGLKLF